MFLGVSPSFHRIYIWILFHFFAFVTNAECQPCLSGWIQFQDKCYLFYEKHAPWKTWPESRTYCKNEHADLVVVGSLQEQVSSPGASLCIQRFPDNSHYNVLLRNVFPSVKKSELDYWLVLVQGLWVQTCFTFLLRTSVNFLYMRSKCGVSTSWLPTNMKANHSYLQILRLPMSQRPEKLVFNILGDITHLTAIKAVSAAARF